MGWLTGWNRRKSKINGTTEGSSPQTNYQMKLTVHKYPGTDTTTDIYLGTNIRDDLGNVLGYPTPCAEGTSGSGDFVPNINQIIKENINQIIKENINYGMAHRLEL